MQGSLTDGQDFLSGQEAGEEEIDYLCEEAGESEINQDDLSSHSCDHEDISFKSNEQTTKKFMHQTEAPKKIEVMNSNVVEVQELQESEEQQLEKPSCTEESAEENKSFKDLQVKQEEEEDESQDNGCLGMIDEAPEENQDADELEENDDEEVVGTPEEDEDQLLHHHHQDMEMFNSGTNKQQ